MPLTDIEQIICRECLIIDLFPDEVSVKAKYLQALAACRQLSKTT